MKWLELLVTHVELLLCVVSMKWVELLVCMEHIEHSDQMIVYPTLRMSVSQTTIFKPSSFFGAFKLLLTSNILIGEVMYLVYRFGKDSIYSELLIYGPLTAIIIVLVRDKCSFSFIFSACLAILHGHAHVAYPFLNEIIGVNTSVDVWQDQTLHLCQAIPFSVICFRYSIVSLKCAYILFVVGNVANVILGYYCWGEECHDMYVWVSLLPALASGFHFATGTLYFTTYDVGLCGFLIQGVSSVTTYFIFKGSDDILKLFAQCRFFELYFIVPHYVGFFNYRYKFVCKTSRQHIVKFVNLIQIVGIFGLPFVVSTLPMLKGYFDTDVDQAEHLMMS